MGRFGLRFDSIETRKEISQLEHFLLRYPGAYDLATYEPWVRDVCVPDIKEGKRWSFGWWQRGALIADFIIKVAEDDTDTVDLRHFRVAAPNFSHRGLGAFALRQLPHVAAEILADQGALSPQATDIKVQLDTKADGDAAHFFEHHGFVPVDVADLYGSGMDVMMARTYSLAS